MIKQSSAGACGSRRTSRFSGLGVTALAGGLSLSVIVGLATPAAATTALSNADEAQIGQRLLTIASTMDSEFLDTPPTVTTALRIAKADQSPQQVATSLASPNALSSGATAVLTARGQDNSQIRSRMQASGDVVTASSAKLLDVAKSIDPQGFPQVTARVYLRHDIKGSNIPWEEVVPYVASVDPKTMSIKSLIIQDGLPTASDQQVPISTGSISLTAAGTLKAKSATASFSTASLGTTGKERAASYADKYWANYNPNYVRFTDDCTNFTSQAFRAGGWTDDHRTSPLVHGWSPAWWSTGDVVHGESWSRSWTVAEDFYGVNTWNQARLWNTQDRYALRRGDILMWKKPGATVMGHVMIVTGYSNGEPLLTYHTNDVHNSPLSAVIAKTGGSNSGYTWFPMGVH